MCARVSYIPLKHYFPIFPYRALRALLRCFPVLEYTSATFGRECYAEAVAHKNQGLRGKSAKLEGEESAGSIK